MSTKVGIVIVSHLPKMAGGRVSFLADRSRGHLDPGARSSELKGLALCDVLEDWA
jgi:hypothetical protein